MGWEIKRFVEKESILEDLVCSICMEVLENPVQTSCGHTFCEKCVHKWLDQGERTCPVDRHQLTIFALKPPTRMTRNLLDKLTIRCKNHNDGCYLMCKFEHTSQLIQHEQKGCEAVNNETKKEMDSLKMKNRQLENDLILKDNTITIKDKIIAEDVETTCHLKTIINETKTRLKASELHYHGNSLLDPNVSSVKEFESTALQTALLDTVSHIGLAGKKLI